MNIRQCKIILAAHNSCVCPKTHSKEVQQQVTDLKNSLKSNTGSITQCSAPSSDEESEGTALFDEEENIVESKRQIQMEPGEKEDVIEELEATSNLQNKINVIKEGCTEKGAVDQNTNTLNMCRSCRYTVTIEDSK